MSQYIRTEIGGAIARVTLSRPDKHNAFDDMLIADLTTALKALDRDPSVCIVVLSAAGKSFSAGADLNWMKRMAAYSETENFRDAMDLAELMHTLYTLSKPSIARVQGAAYGGGVGLVACCDMAIGIPEAAFAFSEVRLGLIPAVISPYVIAAMGQRSAQRYFLTGERFSAAKALQLGLLHELAPNEEAMDAKIKEWTNILLTCSPAALAESKRLIAAVANRPIDKSTLADTAQRIACVRASAEGREGVSAFLEKRKPRWVVP